MGNEKANDIWKQLEEHEALLKKQVYVDGEHIILDVSYPYSIALERCNTEAKILAWVVHLCDKTWANSQVIQKFVRLASSSHGLPLELA